MLARKDEKCRLPEPIERFHEYVIRDSDPTKIHDQRGHQQNLRVHPLFDSFEAFDRAFVLVNIFTRGEELFFCDECMIFCQLVFFCSDFRAHDFVSVIILREIYCTAGQTQF